VGELTIAAAVIAGLVSFLSPCVLPVVPAYLAQLGAVGYVPFPSLLVICAWLAVAAQLTAVVAGRYAPYPSAEERPHLGPGRRLARTAVLTAQRRRTSTSERKRAVGP